MVRWDESTLKKENFLNQNKLNVAKMMGFLICTFNLIFLKPIPAHQKSDGLVFANYVYVIAYIISYI